jgi:hypothetical protein
VLPIAVFVFLCLFAFDPVVFAANLSGDASMPMFEQVRGTLLTVFAFIGIEGASAYSRHARRRRDVGRATVLGYLSVLAIFASVTIVSFGILPRDEIAALPQPSVAGVLEAVVGPWGAVFVGIALIVAVLGAYLSWTLMAAEILLGAARDGDLPPVFARTNAHDVPVGALTMSTLLVQALLVVVLFAAHAFDVALNLTSALALIPYFLTAGFGCARVGGPSRRPASRVAHRRRRGRARDGVHGVPALRGGWGVRTARDADPRARDDPVRDRAAPRGARVFALREWVLFALASRRRRGRRDAHDRRDHALTRARPAPATRVRRRRARAVGRAGRAAGPSTRSDRRRRAAHRPRSAAARPSPRRPRAP